MCDRDLHMRIMPSDQFDLPSARHNLHWLFSVNKYDTLVEKTRTGKEHDGGLQGSKRSVSGLSVIQPSVAMNLKLSEYTRHTSGHSCNPRKHNECNLLSNNSEHSF